MAKDKPYYVDPQKFHEEYELSLIADEPTRKIMLMWEKIARGMSRTFPQVNKIDTDACVNFAVTQAWRKWKKYDKERSNNIFAFFSQIIKNDLQTHHNTIKKHSKNCISLDAIFSANNER